MADETENDDIMMVVESKKPVYSDNELLFFLQVWRVARAFDRLTLEMVNECVKSGNQSILASLTTLISEHPNRRQLIHRLCGQFKYDRLLGELFHLSLHHEEYAMIADILWVYVLSVDPRRNIADTTFYRLMQYEEMARRSFSDGFKASLRATMSGGHLPAHWIPMIARFC